MGRKDASRLHDHKSRATERCDERQACPIEHERTPVVDDRVVALSFLGNPKVAEKTPHLQAGAVVNA
jgi:hypothetical protein